jgi:Holliday junction resolvase
LSNKSNGTIFEREFCRIAHSYGFWAQMLVPDADGQPADIIIARDDITALIDCKDCRTDNFPFSRIKENQYLAMNEWMEMGNTHAMFALKLRDDSIWMVQFKHILKLKEAGFERLNGDQIRTVGMIFEEWIK